MKIFFGKKDFLFRLLIQWINLSLGVCNTEVAIKSSGYFSYRFVFWDEVWDIIEKMCCIMRYWI